MGSLIKETPFSEITATLEILDRLGVGRDDLKKFRSGSSGMQESVANIFKHADCVTAISTTAERDNILALIGGASIEVEPTFVAKEKFKTRKTPDGVKLYYVGDTFSEHFLGQTENGLASTALKFHTLTKDSLDAPIIAELGEAHETKLAHLWKLLVNQGQGQEGPLLTNGYANIFYVRGKDDVLWAVDASWFDGIGWGVEADSVGRPDGWSDGRRVVSR
jgi:hypothetical protein